MTVLAVSTAPRPQLPTTGSWDHVDPWRPNTETFGDTRVTQEEAAGGVVADASGLVRVTPAQIVQPESVDQVRSAIAAAAAAGLQVTTAGTRHSGGGQSLVDGAVLLDMRRMDGMRYDAATGALDVQPGATWEQVQRYLDPLGRAVAVQQSSNVFSVGGAVATNVHGRDVRFGPFIDTVESVKVLLADGQEVTASRDEHPDLFASTLGGYGQTGVVTEARIQTVPNEQYARVTTRIPREGLGARIRELAADPDARLLQVRLPVDRRHMFDEGYAIESRALAGATPEPLKPRAEHPLLDGLTRGVFRGAIHTGIGKRALWELQTRLDGIATPDVSSRNQTMAPSVEFLRSKSAAHHQLLQEYFVPTEGLDGFLDGLEAAVGANAANLLNVTLRWTPGEKTTTDLAYAPKDRVAVVLYLDQTAGVEAQQSMDAFTTAATEAAVQVGGAPYLPYQLSGFTGGQLDAAYPGRAGFFEGVRRWDPENRFAGAIEQLEPAAPQPA